MIHIGLHILVPVTVAFLFYRDEWTKSTFILLATMLVDLDHLLANPIYDPLRCSINFHPLHTTPAIIIYGLMFLIPVFLQTKKELVMQKLKVVHIIGLGLLIHMILDGVDCLI